MPSRVSSGLEPERARAVKKSAVSTF